MALTFTPEMTGAGVRPLRMLGDGDLKVVFGRITPDTSYSAGGWSMAASDMGLSEVLFVQFNGAVKSAANATVNRLEGIRVVYDYTNSKAVAIAGSAAVASAGWADNEVAASTDLSSITVRFMAAGR